MIARDDRLRRGWEVDLTRTSGRSVANRRMVLFTRPNTLGRTRFGVAAGKRLGNAVRRNRAKRLMREALRLNAATVIPGVDILLIARSGLRADDTLADVQKDLRHLLRKANLQQQTQAQPQPQPQPTSAEESAPAAAETPVAEPTPPANSDTAISPHIEPGD